MYNTKSLERLRIEHGKTVMDTERFLTECSTGTSDKGLPLYTTRIGGLRAAYIPFDQLLILHAQYADEEAKFEPIPFFASKDGTVIFPVIFFPVEYPTMGSMQRTLMDSAMEIIFNEEITHKDAIPENQIIAFGHVRFGSLDNPDAGEHVIIETWYIDPHLQQR